MGEYDQWKQGPQVDVQPGETIVGCGHTAKYPLSRVKPDPRNGWIWYEVMPPLTIASPLTSDGNLYARWVVSCTACLRAALGDVRRVEVREHWTIPSNTQSRVAICRELAATPGAVEAYLETLDDEQLIEVWAEWKGAQAQA